MTKLMSDQLILASHLDCNGGPRLAGLIDLSGAISRYHHDIEHHEYLSAEYTRCTQNRPC